MLDRFDYATYRRLLRRLFRTRRNVTFADCPVQARIARYVILRHDVDYDPEAALAMAELEARMGVRATYFLLLSAAHYNLFNASYRALPRRLVALGHDVGLHYDVQAYAAQGRRAARWLSRDEEATPRAPARWLSRDEEATPRAPARWRRMLRMEAEVLGQLAGQPVRAIARHNPSVGGADPFRRDKEFVSAYDDPYTAAIAYCSDSCGTWRPAVREVLEKGPLPSRLQLLIHPIFWGLSSGDRWERLRRFQDRQAERVASAACEAATGWAGRLGVRVPARWLSLDEEATPRAPARWLSRDEEVPWRGSRRMTSSKGTIPRALLRCCEAPKERRRAPARRQRSWSNG